MTTTKAHEMIQAETQRLEAIKAQAREAAPTKGDKDQKAQRFEEGKAFARALFLKKTNLFWDQESDKWFEHLNGRWASYAPTTMGREYGHELPTDDHQQGFRHELYAPQHRRCRKGLTFDFDVKRVQQNEPHLINRAVLDTWVKPVAGDHHPAFDWLLECLSSGRQAERDHIEQCIYWKYTNPAEFRMPALVLFGGAGNGKGVLAEHILKNIFTGEHWTMLSGGAEQLMKFQDSLVGRAVFVFDEANFRSSEHFEFLKALVQKMDIEVNPKGQKPFSCKVQTWFHIFSNDRLHSPVTATGTDVDRRFSFIKTKSTWLQTIAEKLELDNVKHQDGSVNAEARQAASEIMNNDLMPNVFQNRNELGKFLQYLINRWSKLSSCPIAFHGEDYQTLINNAQTTEDILFAEAFQQDPEFLSVSVQALYDLYRHRAQTDGIKANFIKGKVAFVTAAEDFIVRKSLLIETARLQRYKNDGTRSPVQVFALIDRAGRKLVENDCDYKPENFKVVSSEDFEYNQYAHGTPGTDKVKNIASALQRTQVPGMSFNKKQFTS